MENIPQIRIEELKGPADRRRTRRFSVELPLDYQTQMNSKAKGGVTVNLSRSGLMIESVYDMPIGTKLKVNVLFLNRINLSNFGVMGEIVWKKSYSKMDWSGYQYGLKFIRAAESDVSKIASILEEQRKRESVLEGQWEDYGRED